MAAPKEERVMERPERLYLFPLLLLFIAGCSVVMATQQPGRKDLSVLTKGVDRTRVIGELGTPLATEVKDGKKTDVFNVRQGYSTGAKAARAIFHGVADVFTLCLWEVVGTPFEAVASGTDVKVSVCYDTNGKVAEVITYAGKEKVDAGMVPVDEGGSLGQQKIEEKYQQ